MDGQSLILSNRGLTKIDDVYSILAQCSQKIIHLDLSGNYLQYLHIYINIKLYKKFFIEISMYNYHFPH